MRSVAIGLLGVVALIALVGPFLANDVPLVARVSGQWRFPAFESQGGGFASAPDGGTWKDWWLTRPVDGPDFAVMPPWPHGPFEVHPHAVLEGPSRAHPLGVDDSGRDQLTRLLQGARTALLVALGAVVLSVTIGVAIGGLAGLAGGLVDGVLLRVIELFASFPALLIALACASLFGGSLLAVVVVLAIVQWTQVARVVRGELLSLRSRPFVEAARGFGIGPVPLLLRHVLPQLRGPLAVTSAFIAADAIQVESALSFLGLGASFVSWGAMLDAGRAHAFTGAWHGWFFPGLALAVTVVGLHGLANRLGRTPSRALRPESAACR